MTRRLLRHLGVLAVAAIFAALAYGAVYLLFHLSRDWW